MMIARWELTAKFGHKDELIGLLKKWDAEIGQQIGWTQKNTRMLTGSIGAPESVIQMDVEIADLAELDRAWQKLAEIKKHADMSKQIEPHCVSGTNRWTVFRVL